MTKSADITIVAIAEIAGARVEILADAEMKAPEDLSVTLPPPNQLQAQDAMERRIFTQRLNSATATTGIQI